MTVLGGAVATDEVTGTVLLVVVVVAVVVPDAVAAAVVDGAALSEGQFVGSALVVAGVYKKKHSI